MYVLGLEGSANKLGVAIMDNNTILSNLRTTYDAPIGHGFLPRDVNKHHQQNIVVIQFIILWAQILEIYSDGTKRSKSTNYTN